MGEFSNVQILGLSASPAGEKTIEGTEIRIGELERALNCKICLVRENRDQLAEFTSKPTTHVQGLSLPLLESQFEEKIVNYMKVLEKKLQIKSGVDKGTSDYEKFLYSLLNSGISALEKLDVRQLLKLNEMLENFLDIGYVETMKLLEDPIDMLNLLGVTPDQRDLLAKVTELTPKQKKLLENLKKLEDRINDVRVMVFVTTKKGAEVILQIIKTHTKFKPEVPQFM